MSNRNRIRFYRYQRNPRITQRELADQVGVSESTISQYESGQKSPRMKTLKKLSKAFTSLLGQSVTMRDLLDE